MLIHCNMICKLKYFYIFLKKTFFFGLNNILGSLVLFFY